MNMHKILANGVVFGGFLAIPFIPFIVLGQSTFFPFIVGKNFAFRIVIELMFSAWIVLAYIDPAYRPKKSYLMWAFITFLAFMTISAIFGSNPEKSFWSNFERMEGVVTYFHLFTYFIVTSTVLTVRNLWRSYFNLHLAAGMIMAVYGVLQWAGDLTIVQDGMRVNGTLGNAAYLGTYALFNIFLGAFMMARENFENMWSRTRVVIYSLVILVQAFVLYHTATRGAMLGLLAGVGIATLLTAIFEKEKKIIRMSAIGILVAAALLVGGFVAMRDATFVKESPVLSRFAAISLTEQTTKSRFMVWNMAYQGFKEKPVLGWGMENFNYVFNKYYDPNMWGQEQWFDRAHNVFFDWLVSGGLPGLLSYLALFVCAVYSIWRRTNELSILEKSILTGLLGGYFFQNLFVFDNLTSLIYFGTILAYLGGMSQKTDSNIKDLSANSRDKKITVGNEDLTFIVSGTAIVLAFIFIYTVNYNGFMQNKTLIQALSGSSSEGPAYNLAQFKKAIGYGSFGTSEAREQLAQISIGGFDPSKGLTDVQEQFLDLSSQELEKQASELPNDARYQLFAGSFFLRVGMPEKGLVFLKKAQELSPKKQAIFFEMGSAYYAIKDMTKAQDAFKQAFELAPAYAEAEKFYLQILLATNRRSEAEKVLKEYPLENIRI